MGSLLWNISKKPPKQRRRIGLRLLAGQAPSLELNCEVATCMVHSAQPLRQEELHLQVCPCAVNYHSLCDKVFWSSVPSTQGYSKTSWKHHVVPCDEQKGQPKSLDRTCQHVRLEYFGAFVPMPFVTMGSKSNACEAMLFQSKAVEGTAFRAI
eukprot:3580575-Amphidinium_carterae.1